MKNEKKRENYRTISLIEVKRMLGFTGKGFRSVLGWCNEHKILVFGDGRRKRILETDWINTQLKALKKAASSTTPFIREKLKEKGVVNIPKVTRKYKPKSNASRDFLNGE